MIFEEVRAQRAKLIAANCVEYGERSEHITWGDTDRLAQAEACRSRLLCEASPGLTLSARQTKPHVGPLSPGCRICMQGRWSCLFINGKCNCRCFYCPTPQDDISVPTTNRVPFTTPRAYAQYVRRFGFTGASISGGEPLLTFERTLAYIDALRQVAEPGLHIWLYTNGTLATRQKLTDLKSAGLNEIRFDLSAVDYDVTRAAMAADIIDCVTVEIPAIPEDAARLQALLPVLTEIGISHLNLHQLRLTPHNFDRLIPRGYTFLHGESVTVLESELTALALLRQTDSNLSPLSINYCAYAYKRRYQQAATRRRNAESILKGWEAVTEAGFIRTLTLVGPPEALASVAGRLEQLVPDKSRWQINTRQTRIQFHPSLVPHIDPAAGQLYVTYCEAVLSPAVSYRCAFTEVRLDTGQKIYIEKRPVRVDLPIEPADLRAMANMGSQHDPQPELSPVARPYEQIRPGLQDYF